jgi:phenylalanyl-tRNA synthetase beta chain
MQVSYGWLKELVDISWSPEELAEKLTLAGAEAETERLFDGEFDNICVGQIIELDDIKGSDHLKTAVVDTGREKLQIVCGAPNAARGQKVIFAGTGAVLAGGMEIKKVKLRGVESHGMICSEAELGLSEDHSGIVVLDGDAALGQPAIEYLQLNDPIIKLDLTPNRGDLMSAIGIAREAACLSGKKVKRPVFEITEAGEKASDWVKVSIDDSDACPRYAARIIKGVKIGPSPWWIKQKLLLCGIRPISNIVDITNLVMMEYGHPLHAFDYDLFKRKEILVRRAREGELFTTLDGKKHELTPDVLLITDGEEGVAAAGVMGGLESEVSNDTVNILLESAYFDPITIRKSRMKLGMVSESSARFEKGADPNIIPDAINRAAYLMQKYAGGEVLSGIVDCYPKKITPVRIDLRPERVNSLLGTNISRERIVNILHGLEFEVEDKGVLEVTVPTCAVDVVREVDLIEEIVRIEGYDSIPSVDRNMGPLFTPERRDTQFRSEIRNVMTAQGFDEILGSGFAETRLLATLVKDQSQLKILNPIAEDLSVMQNSLFYSLLKAVAHNISRRNVSLRIFEIGKAFQPGDPPVEQEQIGLALSGASESRWYSKGKELSFYDLKGAVDSLLDGCRVGPAEFTVEPQWPFVDGFSFSLIISDKVVGQAGQIIEDVTRSFDIKQPVLAAILDFDKILALQGPTTTFSALPRFPAAPRDLAIVVDDAIPVGDIMSEIRSAAGELLETVELFDLYRGKQIAPGKKSLAFSLTFRSHKRSLESREIIVIQDKIAGHLKERFKAEIREG